jgi:polar amino acid transport system substrate-binding protein
MSMPRVRTARCRTGAASDRFRTSFPTVLLILLGVSLSALGPAVAVAQKAPTTLRVSTRIVPPFVLEENAKLTGFSIDLWESIAERLHVRQTYLQKNSVADILRSVRAKEADIGIAAISITSERDRDFDFSQPIFNGGLQILVRDQPGSGSTLLQTVKGLFSADVLKLLGMICILVLIPAHLIWLVERNRGEAGIVGTKRYLPGIFKTVWWSAATLSTQADEMPKTYIGRFIALCWMFTSVVFIAYFTAQVTASLTVKQLQSTIQGPNDLPGKRVATVAGSTSESYLKGKSIETQPFAHIKEAFDALDAGTIDAVVYDAPVLLYHAAHRGKGKVQTVGSIFKTEGYGILFPPNSPWRKPVNQALLTLKEDGTYDRLTDKWFGDGSK